MAAVLTQEMVARLEGQQNIWFSSVRPDGRPHLTPVWFVWHGGKIYIGTDPNSVKMSNIRRNARVALALEDGEHPLICEGIARLIEKPLPEPLLAAFFQKYEWDVNTDKQYNAVVEIIPEKWLAW